MNYLNIREEELKNRIAQDYFWLYDCAKMMGNVDFCVCTHKSQGEASDADSLLWAEAKKGSSDIYKSLVQLILTVGKARTFDKFLPPAFLGAFDAEKMAFVPYSEVQEIFYQNDFNWNVAPSNHDTKEFRLIYDKVKTTIDEKALLFQYEKDDHELKNFIKTNFVVGRFGVSKTRIDKNNFITIYNKWLAEVKPTVAVNWDLVRRAGIIDGDFYLADLLSQENSTLKEKLYVLLKNDHYALDRKINDIGLFTESKTSFSDNQTAHTQFWNRYERPPKTEYWDYIVERRDLLVPQDVRERKGSFFTPQIWVELSQKYLTDALGEDWQDEYYIWDCAAGTGNLLNGLTNKYHIWASTLDKQDVDVMHDRIANGANLLEDHVFQFDFLNDDFTKLPQGLQNIINDPEKRKKLVIYMNPPYADASSNMKANNKAGNSFNKTQEKYKIKLSSFARELFAQFLIRIYFEIPGCRIAEFSKTKLLTVSHAKVMRTCFLAKLEKMFIVPASTFDNVTGAFPIGFKIWDTTKNEKFISTTTDVFNLKGINTGTKIIYAFDDSKKINKWLKEVKEDTNGLGYLSMGRNDFQNKNLIFIINSKDLATNYFYPINSYNLPKVCIYFATQKAIQATWLNDRDQFLYPTDGWQTDTEFQNDCLAYTVFSNTIQSKYGTNHWIPFTEHEVAARTKFDSDFMSKYIQGKIKPDENKHTIFQLVEEPKTPYGSPLVFSPAAKAVFAAGKNLWTYYHKQPNCNVNASLYDIRAHFQGRNDGGRMSNKSTDETYTKIIAELRDALKILAEKIAPKVYEYGFLK